jgi:FKBP-type peptidyl-prolyl cis-trans isomerase 2
LLIRSVNAFSKASERQVFFKTGGGRKGDKEKFISVKEVIMIQAKYGNKVKVHYAAKLSDGTILTSTFKDKPLEFTIGAGHVIKDIEQTVIGMNVGEAKATTISGEKMFGPYRANNIIEVERAVLSDYSIRIGSRVKIPGQRFSLKVVDISESKVMLDANHPLSERELFFDIQLMAVL